MKTAVVILNWNGQKFLKKFLPNVIKYSKNYAEIIIADNASTDNSISFLQKNFPEIKIIKFDENFGFAEGYNKALEQIDAKYFILLNSDVDVSEHWIEPVIEMMEKDEKIAACQPKILSYSEPEKFEYAGAAGGFIDKFGFPFCRGRVFQSLEIDNGQYDDATEIFWATGACLFVKAELYKNIGGFDNDFFAHMEEIDLCWRLKNAGFKIIYCPDSKIYHVGGGTLPKSSHIKNYLNIRNNIIMLYKNLPKNRLIYTFFVRIILDFIASFKFLFDSGFLSFFAVYKAHFNFYRNIKKHTVKRKNNFYNYRKEKNKLSKIYNRNIAIDYFLLNKRKFSDLKTKNFN